MCVEGEYGFFFFSSRRRHTSSLRDWSSDVCSSDLIPRRTTTATPTVNARNSPVATGLFLAFTVGVAVVVRRGIAAACRCFEIGRASCRERAQISLALGAVVKCTSAQGSTETTETYT